MVTDYPTNPPANPVSRGLRRIIRSSACKSETHRLAATAMRDLKSICQIYMCLKMAFTQQNHQNPLESMENHKNFITFPIRIAIMGANPPCLDRDLLGSPWHRPLAVSGLPTWFPSIFGTPNSSCPAVVQKVFISIMERMMANRYWLANHVPF